MKDRKIRIKGSPGIKDMSDDIRKQIDLIDKGMGLKLQTLDSIFADTKDHPEEFHQLYVQPLLESGLTLEDSFSLLVDGVLRPN
ncbi:MAG: hypothetical protein WAK48_28590 [Candidatus Acidiferrum sp.]|jgi:hypothetical protein